MRIVEEGLLLDRIGVGRRSRGVETIVKETSLLRETPWECPTTILSFLTNLRLHSISSSPSSSTSEEDEEEWCRFRTSFLHGDHDHGDGGSMKEFCFTFGCTWLGYIYASYLRSASCLSPFGCNKPNNSHDDLHCKKMNQN